MKSAYERACDVVVALQREGVLIGDGERACWVVCEAISDALREQVEYARGQVPVTKIEIG